MENIYTSIKVCVCVHGVSQCVCVCVCVFMLARFMSLRLEGP